MFQKNDTRAFLARHATPDLMQYICTLARQRDDSKLEEHRRNQLAAHADEVVEAKLKKQRKRENQALQKAQEIEKSPWVESKSEVNEMTVAAIKMQLEKYRSCIEDIPKKSEINKMKKSCSCFISQSNGHTTQSCSVCWSSCRHIKYGTQSTIYHT
jgi:ATP-dependent protease HslVU (ClpYQ) ATPase subunit